MGSFYFSLSNQQSFPQTNLIQVTNTAEGRTFSPRFTICHRFPWTKDQRTSRLGHQSTMENSVEN